MITEARNTFIEDYISIKNNKEIRLNYNATLKIDDIGFNETNPVYGCNIVWTYKIEKCWY